MAVNLYNQKDSNIMKTWLLMSSFFVAVIVIAWVFNLVYDQPIILIIAVVFSVFMNIFSYWYSDKIALKISGARLASEKEYPELHNIVENLAITAGLPKPRVYIIPDASPNAFATGRDPEHAAVAFTEGLIRMLDKSELEGVAAHELAHVGNRDILLSTIVVVLVGFLALLSDFFLRLTIFGGGGRDRNGNGVMLVIGLVLAILAPIAAMLIQLAVSRRREFLADASAALLTRYPEGLASALRKISSSSQPMQRANNATAHMYISNPFGKNKFKGLHKLFMTHPPVEERINALLGQSVG